ncbi:MAG: GDP-mannose 4,6-dehydratase [Acidobacteria bacterium]|nr:GDP-mannose 4,6-dehydratase [Acidobacteriota bacterium]
MNVLITGGAGFIGSHFTERMLREGHQVTVLDDLSTGWIENLHRAFDYPGFEFVEGSVLDAGVVQSLVAQSDLVVHLAAAVGVRYVLDHPLATIRTNVEGTHTVLDACGRFKKKTLVASTSEVYGKNSSDCLCETADSVFGASSLSRWSYATSKKLDEFLALAYAKTHSLPVIVTRFFNIVGPRQAARYGMVLPNFIQAALKGEPIRVFGDGRQTRNFTYVSDCIDALAGLLRSPEAEGEIVNIGSPHEVSILNLAERVKSIVGSSSQIVKVPYDQAYPEGGFEDMRRRVPCICKISHLIGWSPTLSMDEIITQTVKHARNKPLIPALLLNTKLPTSASIPQG